MLQQLFLLLQLLLLLRGESLGGQPLLLLSQLLCLPLQFDALLLELSRCIRAFIQPLLLELLLLLVVLL